MFDMACTEYDRLQLDTDDPVRQLSEQFDQGLEGVEQREVRKTPG